jgi:hypothetical protein
MVCLGELQKIICGHFGSESGFQISEFGHHILTQNGFPSGPMTHTTRGLITYPSLMHLESFQMVYTWYGVSGRVTKNHLWSFWVRIRFPNFRIRTPHSDTKWIPLGPHDSYNSWVDSIPLPDACRVSSVGFGANWRHRGTYRDPFMVIFDKKWTYFCSEIRTRDVSSGTERTYQLDYAVKSGASPF